MWGPGMHAPRGRRVDASAYEEYIGRWSRLFVPALLAAAEIAEGNRVLDVATGTGEAARHALAHVGDSGRVVGSDISPAMLDEACARLADARFLPVVSDGQSLVFPDATFDAVICQLGLMFFPVPARGLAEFRRVLRLSLGSVSQLERLIREAGFSDVRVTRETRQGTVGSFDEYWAPIEAGVGQMPQAYLALSEPRRRAVREEVRARLTQFEFEGRLVMSAEMLIGSGQV